MSCVYLLKIDPPYQGKKHYIGFTRKSHPAMRVAQHQRGKGGVFTSRVVKAGHKLTLLMFWPGADERFERWLKNRQDTSQWCPHCGINAKSIPTIADMPNVSMEELWREHKRNKKLSTMKNEDAMLRRYYKREGLDPYPSTV